MVQAHRGNAAVRVEHVHQGLGARRVGDVLRASRRADELLESGNRGGLVVVGPLVHDLRAGSFGEAHEPGAADVIWRRYFETWCDAAASDAPFTVMAHPDLAKKFGYYPSYDLVPLYRQAAEAARAGGRMVEVNTSGSYYACKEMFPAPALLRQFCRAGVPCTVGTDAHRPDHVARDVEAAYRLMYECGYRTVTVPTATGDRREIDLIL